MKPTANHSANVFACPPFSMTAHPAPVPAYISKRLKFSATKLTNGHEKKQTSSFPKRPAMAPNSKTFVPFVGLVAKSPKTVPPERILW